MYTIHVAVLLLLAIYNFVDATNNDNNMKDGGSDRGAHSDRGGLWFGPRLGKRSLRLSSEDNRQAFFKLLEAADALKFYYDQLPYYESQADAPEMKVTKKVIFTPKLGRSTSYDDKSYENVEFTPRLGRRLADEMPATPSDQEYYRQDPEQIDSRTNYFSPRLGRTMTLTPRLGRELSFGHLSLIIHSLDGYLLLAANLDDFKTLARQIIPEKFAERLAKLASDSSFVHKNERIERDRYASTEHEDSRSKSAETIRKVLDKPKLQRFENKKEKMPTIDVEKIIHKVKERLEKDYKLRPIKGEDKYEEIEEVNHDKYREVPKKQDNKQYANIIETIQDLSVERLNENENKNYEDYKFDEAVVTKSDKLKYSKVIKKIISNDKRRPSSKVERESNTDNVYEEVDKDGALDKDRKSPSNNDMGEELYKQVHLGKSNDSYEDYVTPARDVSETIQSQDNKQRQRDKVVSESDYNTKARTESLLYDYQEENTSPSEVTVKKLQGTMIPTKEHYKMSSPNYYAKLPVVAEKYDFNEPIPERDREPEDLTNIGNPPASVNKKIRL